MFLILLLMDRQFPIVRDAFHDTRNDRRYHSRFAHFVSLFPRRRQYLGVADARVKAVESCEKDKSNGGRFALDLPAGGRRRLRPALAYRADLPAKHLTPNDGTRLRKDIATPGHLNSFVFQIHEHMTREEMLSVFYTGHGNDSKKINSRLSVLLRSFARDVENYENVRFEREILG